ncbi:unnamed protein product [Sphenostylis stenocarpa]|uniref:Uncharacterized protein n=1 Tax=Sphenostylis stenocarpa TaxID=92480 RepID=A0AA86S954_9FABA|nr:unnamed protein product [Sphenostylis stenocarpa]
MEERGAEFIVASYSEILCAILFRGDEISVMEASNICDNSLNCGGLGRSSRAHQMLYAILIRPSFSWPVIGATRLNPHNPEIGGNYSSRVSREQGVKRICWPRSNPNRWWFDYFPVKHASVHAKSSSGEA